MSRLAARLIWIRLSDGPRRALAMSHAAGRGSIAPRQVDGAARQAADVAISRAGYGACAASDVTSAAISDVNLARRRRLRARTGWPTGTDIDVPGGQVGRRAGVFDEGRARPQRAPVDLSPRSRNVTSKSTSQLVTQLRHHM